MCIESGDRIATALVESETEAGWLNEFDRGLVHETALVVMPGALSFHRLCGGVEANNLVAIGVSLKEEARRPQRMQSRIAMLQQRLQRTTADFWRHVLLSNIALVCGWAHGWVGGWVGGCVQGGMAGWLDDWKDDTRVCGFAMTHVCGFADLYVHDSFDVVCGEVHACRLAR